MSALHVQLKPRGGIETYLFAGLTFNALAA